MATNNQKLNHTPVSDYLKAKDSYYNAPARILNGNMRVLWENEWLTLEEFKSLVKPPIVPKFGANMENPDKTRLWLHK